MASAPLHMHFISFDKKLWEHHQMSRAYSALMDTPGSGGTQTVGGSTKKHTNMQDERGIKLLQATNEKTYWCFTHGVWMEPAEVVLVVDRKPLQEIPLRSAQKQESWPLPAACSDHTKGSRGFKPPRVQTTRLKWQSGRPERDAARVGPIWQQWECTVPKQAGGQSSKHTFSMSARVTPANLLAC